MPLYLYFLVCFDVILRVNSKKYVLRPEWKLKSAHVKDQLKVSSGLDCVVSCESRSDCLAASWSSSIQMCLLGNAHWEGALIWKLDGQYNTLEPGSSWVTYGEIFYPVMHVMNGRCNFTFADAEQVCLAHNTRLATEDHNLLLCWLRGPWDWTFVIVAGSPAVDKGLFSRSQPIGVGGSSAREYCIVTKSTPMNDV